MKVSTYDAEFDMSYTDSSYGKELFDTAIKATGIRESWYFGLSYVDENNEEAWLKPDKKISKQITSKIGQSKNIHLKLKFKFFPENVTEDVIQDVTVRLLYLQIKDEILTENLHCPADKAVILASYAVQAKFNDFDKEVHGGRYLMNEQLLPRKVMSQHKLSVEEWEDKVSGFHKDHRGLDSRDSIMEYLKIAQNLEMYGISYFHVFNTKGSEVLLGVDALGVNVYSVEDRFEPKASWPWSEIGRLNLSKGGKLKIRFTDKTVNKIRGKHQNTAAKIYDLATGNNTMYRMRRSADSLEVQQMKTERDMARKSREIEKNRLRKEMAARERIEKAQKEMEQKFKEIQEDMNKRQQELEESRNLIASLERQLAETQTAREELERQQNELRALLEKLEKDREMEAEERQKLEEEVRAKEAEIDQVRTEVESKEEEARRIQEEMEETKRKLEETSESIQLASERLAQSAVVRETSVEDEDEANGTMAIPEITVSKVGEEDREPDEKTEELLKDLRKDLMENAADDAARSNLSSDRDKFKTLRQVRQGNTKRRIDIFENI